MDFQINPISYKKVIAVPSVIVEENIRLASSTQLKVILYFLSHSDDTDLSIEKIEAELFLPAEDIRDALIFWCERGVLTNDTVAPAMQTLQPVATTQVQETTVTIEPIATEEPKAEKKASDLPISRPSHEQVAIRLQECEGFRELFAEAQLTLGKTIGYDGQSVLIMMHDSYGLPFEVILMAVEYAVSQKKTGFSTIAKIGRMWHELEIDTLEGAMQYIEEHNVINETWNKLRALTDITNRTPTEKQRKYLVAWLKEYGYSVDIIYCAYEESIDHTGKMSMPYMDKIITSWYKNGVKTVGDIQREKAKWEASRQVAAKPDNKKQTTQKKVASYDLDAFTKKAIGLKYKKKASD